MGKIGITKITISVIMIFVGLATDIFWIARLIGNAFPPSMPVPVEVYNAFAIPDIILSIFLYIGAYGLLTKKKSGYTFTMVSMGMWIFDSTLVMSITKGGRLDIIIPSLIFSVFTIFYLHIKS
ncbi:hypothetical protein NLC82_05925 [Candidatus Aminicenantes bacterium AC-335-A11]|jgi:hypothetical protein|nr:hypothetical protein [SCandidatus Aminicenantes bacterium Aminicenantia_JdfR_composite]MCP2597182.1 hypothetical protein [Candidatus Aminicenantes bacterium AC-335-G13]MCP2598289.1 hypothetical protein [Candidatus Aminicenantes bacterium AC-335-L06]MCP2618941.1 hypothetical protein [Candidatus Aminicenantes bacterium AC-335-A11]